MNRTTAECVICGGSDNHLVDRQPEDYEYFIKPKSPLKVYHCRTCGCEFVYPRPSVEELTSFYPLHYHTYNDDHGLIAATLVAMRSKARARFFNQLIKTRPIHLFDVGAGDCRHFNDMSKYGDFDFAGVEIKPEMVEAAARRGYRVELGTIEDLDISSYENRFDIVTMYQLVEHVLDPQLLFRKAFSLLKPGGYVTGQLPSMDCIERRVFGRYWAGYHYPRHIQMVSPKALSALIKQSGFSRVEVKSALHLHAAQSAQNFLIGKLGYRAKMTHGKTPLYSSLLLLAAPFCLLEHAVGKGGMMNFIALKP
ncbi:MAG: class I SAM-dependent methyltransferase [Deltaproteobacteria bacterium]|nr:class I SAM-dependent methyltransferase [Deltaproteobacteria bacterium]